MLELLLGNYGLPGIITIALLIYLKYVDKTHRKEIKYLLIEHREERTEWAKHQDARLERFEVVIRDNSGVLRELRGTLTAMNRRTNDGSR